MLLRAVGAVFLLFLSAADAACLPDATAEAFRQNLTQNGESYPVGLWPGNWAANFVTTGAARILIEEVMGYNAVEQGLGAGTIESFYALLGCTTPNNISDRGCGHPTTYSHIALEAWAEPYQSEWDEIQKLYPSRAPLNVGSMGYKGLTAIYFPQTSLKEAYYQDGIPLDFYRGWNSSWNQAWKYFDRLDAINRSMVLPCSETRFTISKVNEDYLKYTGDAAGVMQLPNGDLIAICYDGHFWLFVWKIPRLAPACRDDTAKCVPYITGGAGWWLDDTMQKATVYNMPLAVAVAREYGTLPNMHTMSFYWWVPDTTFLLLEPAGIAFPPNDFNAHLVGDKRTAGADSLITKIVSQDLATLAPSVEDFVRNIRFNLKDVNAMMRDMLQTGDSHGDVACRWLRENQHAWEPWLPDRTKCFPGFGLYDREQEAFASSRSNRTRLECRPCESGRYSARLDDDTGITYTCRFCEAGTFQSSGAALQCDPCNRGEYQNETGSKMCHRCAIGYYQDTFGASSCSVCPDGTTSLGPGSVDVTDCGCEPGNIAGSNGTCNPCGEGLECPLLASITSLSSGTSEWGEKYVPRVLENFYSSEDDPLAIYRCIENGRCPGGKPGSCSGGLLGIACTDCPVRQVFSDKECQDCTFLQQTGWVVGLAIIASGLILAYYLLTSQSTAKASVLFTTACAFGLTVSSLQSVGIVGMMTVEFPPELKGIFDFMQIFLLDIDSLAFGCLVGNSAPVRYISSALFFPAMVLWLIACSAASQRLPAKYRWEVAKTLSTIGALLQVGFSTMSTISMAPMMCFSHPNGVHSLLKYPSITCGTADHAAMLATAMLLFVFGVLGFLTVCTWAVVQAPKWSSDGTHKNVKAFRFLLFRFRLDSWWFGVPLLMRGPLLSLPVALATDYPPIQVMSMAFVFLAFLVLECRAWPWKVPLLNVIDTFLCFVMTMLVSSTSLHLGPITGVMKEFANVLASVLMGVLGVLMALLTMMTSAALLYRTALGGQEELLLFNLRTQPSAAEVSKFLKAVGASLEEMEESELSSALKKLSVYDLRLVLAYVSLANAEIAQADVDDSPVGRIYSNSFLPPKLRPKARKANHHGGPVKLARSTTELLAEKLAEARAARGDVEDDNNTEAARRAIEESISNKEEVERTAKEEAAKEAARRAQEEAARLASQVQTTEAMRQAFV